MQQHPHKNDVFEEMPWKTLIGAGILLVLVVGLELHHMYQQEQEKRKTREAPRSAVQQGEQSVATQ